MPRYSNEFKEQVVRKMMPPNAQSVARVHGEPGIFEPTLYAWRNRFRAEGQVVPADPSNPESWSGENKLAVMIETAALNEQELAEYCRRRACIRSRSSVGGKRRRVAIGLCIATAN